MLRAFWGIVFVLSLGTATAGELTGTITQVSGPAEVRLKGPGVSEIPYASPWQVIRSGVVLEVPADTSVAVVCSTRHFVRIQGRATWRLDEKACAASKLRLKESEYALVAPQAGRFKHIAGFLVLQKEMRGDKDGDPLAPVVLSPRSTAIRSPRPSLRWLQVPSAVEYQVEWEGRGADAFTLTLDALDVSCRLGICELPWPAERPDLPSGRSFFLTVKARDDIVGPWHSHDSVEVRTLASDASEVLGERLRELQDLGLEGSSLAAARGAVLAQAGLYAEAAESFEEASDLSPTASLRITLADLHFKIGLHRLAQPLYREALEDRDPAVRAAAAFGMGRIEYDQARYHEASLRFQQARELYGATRFSDEAAAARLWLNEAKARIPRWLR